MTGKQKISFLYCSNRIFVPKTLYSTRIAEFFVMNIRINALIALLYLDAIAYIIGIIEKKQCNSKYKTQYIFLNFATSSKLQFFLSRINAK